jgi:hypothetical protein
MIDSVTRSVVDTHFHDAATDGFGVAWISSLMVRRRASAVSNHEARLSASSFETRLSPLLRMRG